MRALLVAALAGLAAPVALAQDGALGQPLEVWSAEFPVLSCAGTVQQGGVIACRTEPGAAITVRGSDEPGQDGPLALRADAEGWVVVGIDRDAEGDLSLDVAFGPVRKTVSKPIARRSFRTTRIDGLPPQTVNPTAPEVLERIARERVIKDRGLSSIAARRDFTGAFVWPLQTAFVTSPWGAQRVLNGTPQRPHYGVDLRGPTGTPVSAPLSGKVVIAEPDLHFEGGMVAIDHGQGLISMYLHMSRLDVAEGDEVSVGDSLGATGAGGRTTGPHLCWRMRWRGRQVDPTLLVGPPDGEKG